jgi:hypothetical protein
MNELTELYARLLVLGFTILREAARSRDYKWVESELELLHNVPSLLQEPNLERHRHFWFTEREHYIQWAANAGSEQVKSRMRTYYEPLWQEMEPILLELLSAPASSH